MIKTIEEQAKTVNEAINKALEQLHATREQVSVEILEEGSRGFLGFMGSKPAKVRVTINQEETYNAIKQELQSVRQETKLYQDVLPKDEPQDDEDEAVSLPKKPLLEGAQREENVQKIIESAKKALQVILQTLDVPYTLDVKEHDDQILLNIHCENENFLIGKRGTNLDAIQYLVNRMANKHAIEKVQVVLDTSDYRVNRKLRLQRLALRLAKRVKLTGKPITIAPMNPHDRRIIHLTLQDETSVRTLSRGTGFLRRIIISPSRNSNRPRRNNHSNNNDAQ